MHFNYTITTYTGCAFVDLLLDLCIILIQQEKILFLNLPIQIIDNMHFLLKVVLEYLLLLLVLTLWKFEDFLLLLFIFTDLPVLCVYSVAANCFYISNLFLSSFWNIASSVRRCWYFEQVAFGSRWRLLPVICAILSYSSFYFKSSLYLISSSSFQKNSGSKSSSKLSDGYSEAVGVSNKVWAARFTMSMTVSLQMICFSCSSHN